MSRPKVSAGLSDVIAVTVGIPASLASCFLLYPASCAELSAAAVAAIADTTPILVHRRSVATGVANRAGCANSSDTASSSTCMCGKLRLTRWVISPPRLRRYACDVACELLKQQYCCDAGRGLPPQAILVTAKYYTIATRVSPAEIADPTTQQRETHLQTYK